MAHKFAEHLVPGDTVKWAGAWLTVLRVSRTADGMRVVYNAAGSYDFIPHWKVVVTR